MNGADDDSCTPEPYQAAVSEPPVESSGFQTNQSRPGFGWDYCFVFRAPVFNNLKERENSAFASGDSSDSERESENYSPMNVCITEEGVEDEAENLDNDAIDAGPYFDSNEQIPDVTEAIATRCDIIARLRSAGFAFSQIYVPSENAIFLRFSLSNSALQEKAEAMGMELELKSDLGGGFITFSRERSDCYKTSARATLEEGCPYFCPSDRILIILATLQSKEYWGCDLDIERLVFKKRLLQAFAVHSKPEQAQLTKDVVYDRWWDPTWTPPFAKMKEYLGARVTLYFCFLSHYAQFLLPISALSIPAFIGTRVIRHIQLESEYELVIAALRCLFGASVVLWTTIFLERWKRRNAEINIEWGLNDYHDDTSDETRPQFKGELKTGFYCKGGFVPLDDLSTDPSTNDSESGNVNTTDLPRNSWQDPREARDALLLSVAVTSVCVAVVATFIFLILHFRGDIVELFAAQFENENLGNAVGNAVPGILNAVVIAVSDPIWRFISVALTRRENHRTNQNYENSIVLKRFSFQFFSNYSSLLYIAFIKPTSNCTNGSCFDELESQMISLVISKATIQQILEIGLPFAVSRFKQSMAARKGRKLAEGEKDGVRTGGLLFASSAGNQYVAEAKLPPYASTIEDYAEIVIQFGFFSLFGVAFPCAALVNLANNLIEVRTDAMKIIRISQRTNADDAADIGTWYHILQFLGWASVLTNTGLLVFTNNSVETVLGKEIGVAKIAAFFIIEHVLFVLKGAVAGLIKDIPGNTYRRLARQDFDAARAFNEGWQNAFRGTSQLVVSEKHRDLSVRQANMFSVVTDTDDNEAEA